MVASRSPRSVRQPRVTSRRLKPRAVLFLRVSTDEQTTKNQGLELERPARVRGWCVVERIEETVSGVDQRSGLARLLLLVHTGAVDVVAVWALDRLGRSMVETV